VTDLVTAEVWMRIEGADTMTQVGTVTYTDLEIADGQLSVESFVSSVAEFVDAVNEILRARHPQMAKEREL
jgi:hypothetical protein